MLGNHVYSQYSFGCGALVQGTVGLTQAPEIRQRKEKGVPRDQWSRPRLGKV